MSESHQSGETRLHAELTEPPRKFKWFCSFRMSKNLTVETIKGEQ